MVEDEPAVGHLLESGVLREVVDEEVVGLDELLGRPAAAVVLVHHVLEVEVDDVSP